MTMISLLMLVSWLLGTLPCQVDWNMVVTQPGFDLDQYMGTWYEISYFDPEEPPGSPWIMDNLYYIYQKDGPHHANATMVGNMRQPPNSPCFHRNGKGYMQLDADPSNPAKMVYKISRSGKFPDMAYYVLSTDYRRYSLVLQCPVDKLVDGHCQGGSKINVFSRGKTLDADSKMAVSQIVARRTCVHYEDLLEIRFNKDRILAVISLALAQGFEYKAGEYAE